MAYIRSRSGQLEIVQWPTSSQIQTMEAPKMHDSLKSDEVSQISAKYIIGYKMRKTKKKRLLTETKKEQMTRPIHLHIQKSQKDICVNDLSVMFPKKPNLEAQHISPPNSRIVKKNTVRN